MLYNLKVYLLVQVMLQFPQSHLVCLQIGDLALILAAWSFVMMMLQNPGSHLQVACLPIGGVTLILAVWSVVILILQNLESHFVGMVVFCF